jgi:class 3 adenylate cyclase
VRRTANPRPACGPRDAPLGLRDTRQLPRRGDRALRQRRRPVAPERARLRRTQAIIERYFGAFLDEIGRHGGDVNETAGDGLMVLFQSDDPAEHARSAVRASLGIQRLTRELNEQQVGAVPVQMHIGVNSGVASVGATKMAGAGGGARWTYTASGPTTNIAARVGALGHPITISETTQRRLGAEFELEDLGPHPLKNVAEPIRVFLVVSEVAPTAEAKTHPISPTPALAPLPEGWYRAAGLIREAGDGRPLPGLQVRIWDKYTFVDDEPGSATTDDAGRFEVRFTADAFQNTFDTEPDLYAQVLDAAGQHELLSTRGEVRWNAEHDSWFELEIPAERLATPGKGR